MTARITAAASPSGAAAPLPDGCEPCTRCRQTGIDLADPTWPCGDCAGLTYVLTEDQ